MKIGIDARSMLGTRTGIGRYLETLLPKLAEIDRENEYLLYFDRPPDRDVIPGANFHTRVIRLPAGNNYFTWLQLRLPGALKKEKVDLFHFTFYTMPFRRLSCRAVVTMADISYETHPEWYSLKSRIAMRPFSRLAARRSDLIITTSEFSRREIADTYRVPEEKIRVTYLSPYQSFERYRNENRHTMKKRFRLGDRYILYVGSLHTRRNTARLLEAFAKVRNRGIDTQLVFVGKKEHPFENFEEDVSALGLGGSVRFLDFVEEKDLVGLYYGADIFIYPSLYEGFGLPVLEAMYCGIPVITSKTTSLPEVAGEGALLIDPLSVDAMAGAMDTLSRDRTLRARLIEKGKKRAALFTGEKLARETLDAYQTAAGGG